MYILRRNLSKISGLSSCVVFDGKQLSKNRLQIVKNDVEKWILDGNRPPHLSAVIVGDDPASIAYIRIKSKAAKRVGITSNVVRLKHEVTQYEVIRVVEELNKDQNVDGILIQLPLPLHLNEYTINETINPNKDVDGFTQTNMGRLCMNSSFFVPCTAMAVYHIINHIGVETQGKHALICGRSKHIGLPITLMLHSSRFIGDNKGFNMTTSLCHRFTPKEQLEILSKEADIIISAAGVPGLITGNMVKQGAIVIDVGMTRIHNEGSKATFIGDVNFDDVKQKASHITPVPGGVGPLTVAVLMENTLKAAKHNVNFRN